MRICGYLNDSVLDVNVNADWNYVPSSFSTISSFGDFRCRLVGIFTKMGLLNTEYKKFAQW